MKTFKIGPLTIDVADNEVYVQKDDVGWTLRFTRDEWEAFIAGVKAGEFDLTALDANRHRNDVAFKVID